MNREQFVRMSNTVLRQQGIAHPEPYTEALASAMDLIALTLGDAAPAPPAARTPEVVPPRAAFPSPNPAAVEPVVEPQSDLLGAPPPGQGLIIPATRIPDSAEIGKLRAPAAPPPPAAPAPRMKVEELSQYLQDHTPARIAFDVPMEDGSTRRMVFARDVLSMHNFDSVKLLYYPPSVTSQVARESVQVACDLHIDDAPFDLPAIVERLRIQAIESVRPREIPQSVMPAPTSGPVRHAGDTYQDPAMLTQTQSVFNSMG